MAPCSANFSSIHHMRLPERDNIKLRKPIVEKMRRDRINVCIEQLKVILESEFHEQEPNAKLEKADILEMTVRFLRQQLRSGGLSQRDHSRGYSQCWRESLQFLSVSSKREPSSVTPLRGNQQQHHHHHHQHQHQHQQVPHTQRANSSSPVSSTLGTTTTTTTLQETRTTTAGPVWRPW